MIRFASRTETDLQGAGQTQNSLGTSTALFVCLRHFFLESSAQCTAQAREMHIYHVDPFLANPCEQDLGKAGRDGEGRHDHAGQGKKRLTSQELFAFYISYDLFQLAIDDDSNQTAQMTASILNWPQVLTRAVCIHKCFDQI